MVYDRDSANAYAKIWAYKRNPIYYNFDRLGGDCTNFVSQCIFAGAKIMNFSSELGWFYNNLNSRAPAWTGVDFLIKFLLLNKGAGPYASEVTLDKIDVGDVIFLGRSSQNFYHSLFVSNVYNNQIFVASHTRDAYDKPLSNYLYNHAKFVRIDGVNN